MDREGAEVLKSVEDDVHISIPRKISVFNEGQLSFFSLSKQGVDKSSTVGAQWVLRHDAESIAV